MNKVKYNNTSERFRRLNSKIMHLWEERACAEVKAADQQNSLALRNSLPDFLDQIADALSTTINRTRARIRWDVLESKRIGQKHGKERAEMISYTMDQLIFEYHILRQVICEVMEEEVPLTCVEREIIVCAIEQAVNDAATQFSETLRLVQERFTQTLAHDLKGPITAAKMSAQIILKKAEDVANTIKVANRISIQMERLNLMITDLLDAGKLRAGEKLKLEFSNCELGQVLKQVAEETNFLQNDRIKLDLQAQASGNWNAEGLRRVFDNLIGNALKFGLPETEITLKLETKADQVEASVHNFGVIQASEVPKLFEYYQRAAGVENKKGWGLGLTVVKGITEAHGGKVEVESSQDAGTVFKIILPLNAELSSGQSNQSV